MQKYITHITVVPETKALKDYQRGDIGKLSVNQWWYLCCPGCGTVSGLGSLSFMQHDDGTVSSKGPLHCHGFNMRQRYSIERNEVKWL
jgi:hypothetical protein